MTLESKCRSMPSLMNLHMYIVYMCSFTTCITDKTLNLHLPLFQAIFSQSGPSSHLWGVLPLEMSTPILMGLSLKEYGESKKTWIFYLNLMLLPKVQGQSRSPWPPFLHWRVPQGRFVERLNGIQIALTGDQKYIMADSNGRSGGVSDFNQVKHI